MRRRAAVAVLVGFGLFAAVQFGFGTAADAEPRLRDPAFADKVAKMERLGCDRPVVMLGSSRTHFAFHGERFGLATGAPAFNFGFPAAGPVVELIYLNRLLALGVQPRLVLVEVLPPLLADGPDGPIEAQFLGGERLTGAEVELVEGLGFPPHTARPRWERTRVAPSYALRYGLLARVFPQWVPPGERCDWGRKSDPHGWSTPPRTSVADDERAVHVAKARAEYADTLARLNPRGRPLEALRRIAETGRDRGVPVVLVLMPEATTFRAMYPAGLDERIEAELNALGVPLIDARGWLADTDFFDGHHQLTPGAEKFTDELARRFTRGTP